MSHVRCHGISYHLLIFALITFSLSSEAASDWVCAFERDDLQIAGCDGDFVAVYDTVTQLHRIYKVRGLRRFRFHLSSVLYLHVIIRYCVQDL